jgi:hypothetical protein
LNDVVSLRDDAALNDFAVVAQRNLARHEHEAIGDGGLAEGQMLTAGAGSRPADTLDRHTTSFGLRPQFHRMIYQKCSAVKQKCSENDMLRDDSVAPLR